MVNASNATRTSPGSASHASGRRRGDDVSERVGAPGAAGTAGAGDPGSRCRRLDLAAIKYYRFAEGTVVGTAGASSRAPATPARTASSSTSRPSAPPGSGTRCSTPARRRPAAGRARGPRHAAARGRHGPLRPRDRRDDDPLGGRPRLGGEARQGRLRRPRGARAQRAARRSAAAAGRLRGRRPRHRAPGPRLAGRGEAGTRHQRHLEPDVREGARHGLRAGGARRARHAGRDRRARQATRGRLARCRSTSARRCSSSQERREPPRRW